MICSLVILTVCMIVPSPFLDVIRMPTSTVSFHAQLDSGIFPWTYDLNGFKFRFTRHLFTFGFLSNSFPVCFSSFSCFSCNFMPSGGCSVLHGVNLN